MAADDINGVRKWDAFLPPGRGGLWPWSRAASMALGILFLAAVAALTSWWGITHFEERLDRNAKTATAIDWH